MTSKNLRRACNDPWDYCGLDSVCKRDCFKPEPCKIPKLIDRLAAYEDTGLEPEDILRILDAYGRGMTLRTESAQRLEIVKGIQTDRLRELAQADREGRCVVLPCKPSGVTVYQLRNKKHARGIGVSPRHISCATVWDGVHYALHHQGQDDCLGRDFKKTWFLDKAEAQAALRREQE